MHQQASEAQSFLWEITDLINFDVPLEDFAQITSMYYSIFKLLDKGIFMKTNELGEIVKVSYTDPGSDDSWTKLTLVSVKNT